MQTSPRHVSAVHVRNAGREILLEQWVEENMILGKLQNGFRKGRSLDDNLFVEGQCIDVANMQNSPLWLPFLGIEAAYHNVDRDRLWNTLEDLGAGTEFINLLWQPYSETQDRIMWKGVTNNRPV